MPGLGDEAGDLAQDVFIVVVRELPRFERRREGSFRAWLRKVTVNQARTYREQRRRRPAVGLDPTDGFLDRLEDPNSDLAREWDRDHDQSRRSEAAGDRPGRFPADDLGGVPTIRPERPAGGARGRGTGADRERGPPGQVEDPQAVTARSRRPLEIIRAFSRQVRAIQAAFLRSSDDPPQRLVNRPFVKHIEEAFDRHKTLGYAPDIRLNCIRYPSRVSVCASSGGIF